MVVHACKASMRQKDCHNCKASWARIARHCLKKLKGKKNPVCLPLLFVPLFFVLKGVRKCAMACTFLNTLLVLWPKLWSIFINVPCALQRNILCLGGVFHKFLLCPVGGSASLSPTYPCWLPAYLLRQVLKKKKEKKILEMPT